MPALLLISHLLRSLWAHGWHLVLQQAQLGADLLGHKVGARTNELPSLQSNSSSSSSSSSSRQQNQGRDVIASTISQVLRHKMAHKHTPTRNMR
jgi:hypothetical protein